MEHLYVTNFQGVVKFLKSNHSHAGFYEVLLIGATYLLFSEPLIEISMGHLHDTVTWYKNTLQESTQRRCGTLTK